MSRAREANDAAVQAARAVLDKTAARRDDAWREAAEANRKRALTVATVPFALGAVLVLAGIAYWPLVLVGVAVFALWALVAILAWRAAVSGSAARLTGLSPAAAVGAGLIEPLAAERYEDLTESLCAALGLHVPTLLVLDDPAPNALTTGAAPGSVRIALTSGLLSSVERIELEAVLAHELVHVKRLDTLSGGLSAALLHGGHLQLPGVRSLAAWLEGPDREVEADLLAVAATRYPPGLIGALEKVTAAPSVVPERLSRRSRSDTAAQWLAPFGGPAAAGSAAEGRFDPAARLALLREL